MYRNFKIAATTLIVCLIVCLIVGCGSGYPSVSGKVTNGGQPVAGARIMFLPVSTSDNPFPGPYAEGVTDSEGRFSLVTRDGESGATPGINKVELYTSESVSAAEEFQMAEIERLMARANGDESPTTQVSQAAGKRDPLSPSFRTEITVPADGTEDADFDLATITTN